MRNLTTTLCLTLAVLMGSAGVSWSADLNIFVTTKNANVRMEPNTSSEIITTLKQNTEVGVLDMIGDNNHFSKDYWYLVSFGEDQQGYTHGGLLVNKTLGWSVDYQRIEDEIVRNSAYVWAVRELIPLATKGSAIAQYKLATLYDPWSFRGGCMGCAPDIDEAMKWYPLAAKQGHNGAQHNLGVKNQRGNGIPSDYGAAMKWYLMAAAQGYTDSQINIGTMYQEGQGVARDNAEAAKWYRMAAERGNALAQSMLGDMYQDGQGVTRDKVIASMWFSVSASQGHLDGRRNQRSISVSMTPSQIEKAQDLARECVAKNYKNC